MEKRLPPEIISKILKDNLSLEEEEKIARRILKQEGVGAKEKSADGEVQYRTYDEESGKTKQKTANRLKSRGFRGEIIAKLIY